jgi:outer membrane lipoprotein-sorting protein
MRTIYTFRAKRGVSRFFNIVFTLLLSVSALVAQQPKPAPSPEVAANARKAREVLERSLQALGGRAYLDVKDLHQEGRTSGFYRGTPSMSLPYHRFWKAPDKVRMEFFKKREWIVIINGNEGTDTTYHGTSKVDDDYLVEHIRRRNHSLDTIMRHWLDKPDLILTYDGVSFSDRKQVDKVSLTRPGFYTVTVYVDTASSLPLRTLYTFRDPKTREMVEEGQTFDNYRVVQGINTPHNVVVTRDGEMRNQFFVRSVEYNTGLPDSKFQASITYDPKLR